MIGEESEYAFDNVKGDIIVCQMYKLMRGTDGEFSLDLKKRTRDNVKITKDWFIHRNSQTFQSGELYVYDAELTEKYYKEGKEKLAARKQKKAVDKTAEALLGAITKAASSTAKQEVESDSLISDAVIIPEGTPKESWDKSQIHEWIDEKNKEGAGIEYKKTLGVATLIETIVNPYLETLKNNEDATK